MKNKVFVILGIIVFVFVALLIMQNIKEPSKDITNHSANFSKEINTTMSNTNRSKENVNKEENTSKISHSSIYYINTSKNSKIKKYIYKYSKDSVENISTIISIKNYTAPDGNLYIIIEAGDVPEKEALEFKEYNGQRVPIIKCPPCETTDTSEYLNTTFYINLNTNEVKRISSSWLTLFKMQNNTIYKKLIPPTNETKLEENFKIFNWNKIDVEAIRDMSYMSDLIFSFDILFFQDLKDIERFNMSGIKNAKLIKTECNNERLGYVCTAGGCHNYTMYNCSSFWNITYNLTYGEERNNKKTIGKSWIEHYECEIGRTKEQEKAHKNQSLRYCDGINSHPSFEKIYFAGTENFNGKIAYKIIYEKFENVSETIIGYVSYERDTKLYHNFFGHLKLNDVL